MYLQIIFITTLAIITTVTFIENLVVLLALIGGRHQPLTQTFAMTVTVSLVTADLLISVSVMPLSIYNYTSTSWKLGNIICRLFVGADILFCTASIFHLTVLTCDRYLAVRHPFLHRRLTVAWARGTCLALWVCSALIAVPMEMGSQSLHQNQHVQPNNWQVDPLTNTSTTCDPNPSEVFVYIGVPLAFFLPLFLNVGFHVAILMTLRASDRSSSNDCTACLRRCREWHRPLAYISEHHAENDFGPDVQFQPTEAKATRTPREVMTISDSVKKSSTHLEIPRRTNDIPKDPETNRFKLVLTVEALDTDWGATPRRTVRLDRAVRVVLWLILCFAVCWLPYFLCALIYTLGHYEMPRNVALLVTWLGYLNSTLNPFLLYRFNRTIRATIRRFLKL